MTREEAIKVIENRFSIMDYCESEKLGEALEIAIEELEQEPCETIKEIPKDYYYDTETEDFLVYRHKYTGHEIHIEKPVPRYRLEQEPCEDIMAIHTQGLDEGIRCAMCTNSMKSDRGCDGGCVVNEAMYKEVMNTIGNHIVPSVTPKPRWIPCSERMPEDGELVLFSTKTDRVYEGRFFVDNTDFQWYAFRDEAFAYNNVVTAWLPLPKPYKTESEDK